MPRIIKNHVSDILSDILLGDEGYGLTVTQAAQQLLIGRTRLSELIHGRCGISGDMALRLSRLFPNTSAEFWLKLQIGTEIANLKGKQKIKAKKNGYQNVKPIKI